jgi:hypothetical protein
MGLRALAGTVLLVAGLAATLAPFPQQPASASCAGPTLSVVGADDPPVVLPGAEVTVEGRFFVDGCDDTGGSNIFGCEEPSEAVNPMHDVELVIKQRGREWVLGSEDAGSASANQLGEISWTAVIPSGVRPGAARLVASSSETTRIRIRVGR